MWPAGFLKVIDNITCRRNVMPHQLPLQLGNKTIAKNKWIGLLLRFRSLFTLTQDRHLTTLRLVGFTNKIVCRGSTEFLIERPLLKRILRDHSRIMASESPSLHRNYSSGVKTSLCLIDLFHKWRPINYSFVFMKITLTSLVRMCKFQKNFYSEMRSVGLINTS